MKAFRILAAIIPAVLIICSVSATADEKPWFDMENCSFCKTLTAEPGLMDNMTREYHNISNGALGLTMVTPEFREAYLTAQKKMEELGKELAAGSADVQMCGFCEAYSGLMMLGAKPEVIETRAGWITLLTSDKPEVIEKIQQMSKRTMDEMAKMRKSD